jgi:hypothetical protein
MVNNDDPSGACVGSFHKRVWFFLCRSSFAIAILEVSLHFFIQRCFIHAIYGTSLFALGDAKVDAFSSPLHDIAYIFPVCSPL